MMYKYENYEDFNNNKKNQALKPNIQKNNKDAGSFDFSQTKNLKELEKDFEFLKECIRDGNMQQFKLIISDHDDKFYLENNDRDYELFVHAARIKRGDFIKEMVNMNYQLNPNMLLIELYEYYVYTKELELDGNKKSNINVADLITDDTIDYLIDNNYGINSQEIKNKSSNEYGNNLTNRSEESLESKNCILEFYFLLMAEKYKTAVKLLDKSSSSLIKTKLNKNFIGDELNLIERILTNTDFAKTSICSALNRNLDGVAYEIFNYSGIDLDEEIINCAVIGNCSIFLEDVWESTKKYGNLKNFYTKRITFSTYIQIMLENGKYEMASYAIKNWYDAYKEDGIFEKIVKKNEDLAM